MLYIIQDKKKAKQAETTFDRAQNRISNKAEARINLNSGDAVSQVSDIAALSRKACDDLYSTYQGLVKLINDEAKPMMDQNPGPYAVKEVVELIKWLNKESEIGANFSGSLNGSSVGTLVAVKYFPSVENKVIENYWASKYELMPDIEKASAEKKYQEEQRKEREEQRAEEMAYFQAEQAVYMEKLEEKKRIKETAIANSQKREAELKDILGELRIKYQIAQKWLAIGDNHVLIRNEDGTVTGIGKNNFKQCDVSSWKDVVQVVACGNMSYGLTSSGKVYSTGTNYAYEKAVKIYSTWSGIKMIAAGENYLLGIDSEGRLYSTKGANGTNPKMIDKIYAYNREDYHIYKDRTSSFGDEKYLDFSPSSWNQVCLTENGVVKILGKMAGTLSADVINSKGGIVKVINMGGRPIGITREGKIVIGRGENLNSIDVTYNKISKFIDRYDGLKNGRIVAMVCKSSDLLVFLTDQGKVYLMDCGGRSSIKEGELTETVKKPFENFDIAVDRILNPGKYIEQAQKEAAERSAKWMSEGRCRYCGGLLKKGLFGFKCTDCGKKKDYLVQTDYSLAYRYK